MMATLSEASPKPMPIDFASLLEKAAGSRVCLLAGTAPPDRRLHAMIEGTGWIASGPTLQDRWRAPGRPVPEGTGRPVEAIADQIYEAQDGPRGFYDLRRAHRPTRGRCGSTAAILWYTEEEEALVWHSPAQRDALAAADIPLLTLTRRDWAARDGVDRDIQNFLKGLNA